MEKHLYDKREKLAFALLGLAAGAVAVQIKKGNKFGILRQYPGGTVFADIFKTDKGKNKLIERFDYGLSAEQDKAFDFGEAEHTEQQIHDVGDFFDVPESEDVPKSE